MVGQSTVKLFLAGDVMLGRGIDQILPHPSLPVLYESYVKDARRYVRLAECKSGPIPRGIDCRYVWGDACTVLTAEKPDLRIVNLETSVTTSDDYWRSKGINYRMHPDNASCLVDAGIDSCVLANNHVLDWGYAGLEETLTTLARMGVSTAGAGANLEEAMRPARLPVDGEGDVLVFSFAVTSSGVPDSWLAARDQPGIYLLRDLSVGTAQEVVASIHSHKNENDIVVASIHWGSNWGDEVPKAQRRFARQIIDDGDVAVVHGHSSHHARPIEIHAGRPILYGCGDFLNDYEGIGGHERFRPWISAMYFVTVNQETHRLERLEIVPMCLQQFRLTHASAGDRLWLRDKLNKTSTHLEPKLSVTNGRLVTFPHASAKDYS